MKVVRVAFYGLALGLLAVGLRELLTGFEENRCSMTYMFEYPEYRVSSKADYYLKLHKYIHITAVFAALLLAVANIIAPSFLNCLQLSHKPS